MSVHTAWRAAFAIVPVPILLSVAVLTLIFGTDCPAGPWSDRHTLIRPPLSRNEESGHFVSNEKHKDEEKGAKAVDLQPIEKEGNKFPLF